MGGLSGAKVLVTGGTGFLGQRVCAAVSAAGAEAVPVSRRTGYDLLDQAQALTAVFVSRPDVVVHLAATVGGIGANQAAPATFFSDNMRLGMNIVHAAAVARARLVMVGTVCSYPKLCPAPFKEADLWNGYPEETNAPYGVAKRALIVMLQAYRKQFGARSCCLIPTNLFGPGDAFEENKSHVIPALIKRFHEAYLAKAAKVTCWGTGQATRSFLYVDDAADAIARACAGLNDDVPVNLAGVEEVTMAALASRIADLTWFEGEIAWDASKPDGQPRRLVDGTRAKTLLGWSPTTSLDEGLQRTVRWFVDSGISGGGRLEGASTPTPQ